MRGREDGTAARDPRGTDKRLTQMLLVDGGFTARENLPDAANLRPYAFQLFFDVLVAAIDVIDAIDDGLAVGDQRG